MTGLIASPTTWIFFGLAGQLSLLAYARAEEKRLALAPPFIFAICLIAAIPTARDSGPIGYQVGMGYGLFLASAVVASSAPAIMNLELVAAITAAYWLSFLLAAGRTWWGSFALIPSGFFGAPASVMLAYAIVTGERPERWLRFMLAVWALVAAALVGAINFPYMNLGDGQATWVTILTSTYFGAHLCLLCHNALSLLLLIPIAGKGQSYEARLKEIEAYAGRMIGAFSPEPASPRRVAVIVAVQTFVLGALALWKPRGAGLALHATASLCLAASAFFTVRPEGARGGLPTGGDVARDKRRRRAS